ncbi:MAG: hypothetical protein ACOYL8_03490 [Patescibacteria group bacterium]
MNIIINGFHNLSQIDIINKLVKKNNFEYIHHISCDGVYITTDSPKTTINTSLFYVISRGDYDFSDCPPLDEWIIEKMSYFEPTIIKLMDRLGLSAGEEINQYEKRYALYLKHLRYWNNIIKSRKIDSFISLNVPHEIYDYVIYALCKIYKIPVLFFFQAQMHDTVIALSEIKDWQRDVLPEYKKLQQIYLRQSTDSIPLSDRVLREWSIRAKTEEPFYMNKTWYGFKNSGIFFGIKLFGNKNRLKKISNPVKLVKFFYFLIKRLCQNKILFFIYKLISSKPDYSKKYIYFPLHLQPELTTCPMGGAMTSQELIVDIISKSLPENVFLYVKENPKQTYLCRGYDYYNNILKTNKNIVFMPRNTDTYKLIKNSIGVATVTGTAGWEALFEKKPALVFGDCFYDSAPGVFKIKSLQDCQSAIKNIVNNDFKYEEKNLKLFLQAVNNTSLNCCSDSDYFSTSSLSVEENNNRLFDYLENYLINFLLSRIEK